MGAWGPGGAQTTAFVPAVQKMRKPAAGGPKKKGKAASAAAAAGARVPVLGTLISPRFLRLLRLSPDLPLFISEAITPAR